MTNTSSKSKRQKWIEKGKKLVKKFSLKRIDENETILFFARRHILYLIKTLYLEILGIILVLTVIYFFYDNIFFMIISGILSFISLLSMVFKIICHNRSFLLVTNMRVYINNRKGIFSKNQFQSVEMNQIKEIKSDYAGFFPIIADFGDLYLDTSGETIVFQNLPYAKKVAIIINKIIDEHHKGIKPFSEKRKKSKKPSKRVKIEAIIKAKSDPEIQKRKNFIQKMFSKIFQRK